jgi:endonuclease/exonuclease/phosphatase family metal-dependent hydrolase
MKVVTYNLFLSTPTLVKHNSQAVRSVRIGKELLALGSKGGVDVFCVQELIQKEWLRNVYDQLRTDYPYITKEVRSSWFRPIAGGLYIISKHPIVRQKYRVFVKGDCSGIECLVSKGVVWALLDTPEGAVDVLNTHLQAWDNPTSREIRKTQITEIREFITELRLPADRPLVLCGDFNFDFYTSPDEIAWIEEFLGCTLVVPPDVVFSSDPKTNQLVGNDSSSEYRSSFYPNGCYAEYQETLTCPCCPRELLDLVFVAKCGSAQVRVLNDFRARAPFLASLNFTTERFLVDLSDHYPVLANVHFTGVTPLRASDRYWRPPRRLGQCTIFLVIVLICILGLSWWGLRRNKKKSK